MIRRDRRNAAPVINAGINQRTKFFATEIGRRLDRHFSTENAARSGDGPAELIDIRFRRRRHLRTRLGTKILNDDFLDMTVTGMQVTYIPKCRQAVFATFANADQNTRGKRHPRLACETDCFQPSLRVLVWRAEMRTAPGE